MVELVAQGHCTTWVGIALLSCQCNAVLSGALVLYLVHCFVVMKPVTPLQPRVRAVLKPASPLPAQAEPQLKPSSPLRVRNGWFECVFRLQRCRRFQQLASGGEPW